MVHSPIFLDIGMMFLKVVSKLPQLKTGPAWTDLRSVYSGCFVAGFFTEDRTPTDLPWTDSSNVRNFDYALSLCRSPSLGLLDTSSAESIEALFNNSIDNFCAALLSRKLQKLQINLDQL